MEDKANIVRTSVRMDENLHRKLNDYVNGLKYSPNRTSIDAVVQDAVRLFLKEPTAQSPISNGLRRKVEIEAEKRGMTLEMACTEALNEWLSPTVPTEGTPLTCPPHLEDIVRRLIERLSRPGAYERMIDNALHGIVKDFSEEP